MNSKQIRAFWLVVVASVLIFGFQNCGGSSFDKPSESVQNEPFQNIIVGDAQFKAGRVFNYYDESKNSLKAEKLDKEKYLVEQGFDSYNCKLDGANPIEELMQITNVATVTHPSMAGDYSVCEIDNHWYVSLGKESKIFLIAKDEKNDCLTYDPALLLNEGKRVFLLDNMDKDELLALLDAASELTKSCEYTNNQIVAD